MIEYINETVIPAVHTNVWYHKYFVNDPGQLIDYNNKILGIVRIRQHRMPNNSCSNKAMAEKLHTTCVQEFGYGSHMKKNIFQEGWQTPAYYEIEFNRLEAFWMFNNSGSSTTGEFCSIEPQ